MELTNYAKAIKAEMSLQLQKQGSSLENFEKALKSLNTGEGVYKVAEEASGMLFGLPEMAFKSSLAGGAMAGLTLDEMDKSVDSLNGSLDRERQKVNLVKRITQNLRREHGII